MAGALVALILSLTATMFLYGSQFQGLLSLCAAGLCIGWLRRGRVLLIIALIFGSWHAVLAIDDYRAAVAVQGRGDAAPQGQLQVHSPPVRIGTLQRFEASPLGATYRWRLYAPADTRIAEGDVLHGSVRLRPPSASQNMGGFDYARWLAGKGITATGMVTPGARYACVEKRPGILCRLQTSRSWLHQRLQSLTGEQTFPIWSALLLGDRRFLQDSDWQLLRLTGLSHVVAISGLHLALVYFSLLWLLRSVVRLLLPWLAVRRVRGALLVTSGLALLLAGGFAVLSGWGLPVQRALLMLTLWECQRWLGMRIGLMRSLFGVLLFAMVILLLKDPLVVLDVSFWLSSLAVAAIVWIINERPSRGGGKAPRALWQQLSLGGFMGAASALFFGQFSAWGFLFNLGFVPLLMAALVSGLVALLLTISGIADALWGVLDPLFWHVLTVIDVLGQQAAGMGGLRGLATSAVVPVLLLIALWLFVPWSLIRRLSLCLWPVAALAGPCVLPPGILQLSVFDVGQGSAALLRSHQHAILVDSGPRSPATGFDAGESVVLPGLQALGIHRLDAILISHDDLDHAGGYGAVRHLEQVALGSIADCPHGREWRFDELAIRTLRWQGARSGNDGSCVLEVVGDGFSLLMPGDIEAAAERVLLGELRTGYDLVVAPHHGSRTSSTRPFVFHVSPQWVIYSAGYRHRYGHPASQVVRRWSEFGSAQLNTAKTGGIEITFCAGGICRLRVARQHGFWWQRERMRRVDSEAVSPQGLW